MLSSTGDAFKQLGPLGKECSFIPPQESRAEKSSHSSRHDACPSASFALYTDPALETASWRTPQVTRENRVETAVAPASFISDKWKHLGFRTSRNETGGTVPDRQKQCGPKLVHTYSMVRFTGCLKAQCVACKAIYWHKMDGKIHTCLFFVR